MDYTDAVHACHHLGQPEVNGVPRMGGATQQGTGSRHHMFCLLWFGHRFCLAVRFVFARVRRGPWATLRINFA